MVQQLVAVWFWSIIVMKISFLFDQKKIKAI